ncbi:epoxide hydrolase N-terminal domain-containing protein [Streptomyces sp. NPDC051020]|uniref:epoxide hydrolase N-terminal domain-containing protein n=1 Tax=Streptomyces sp. NPDC051020 TaxID=3155409 RepID=UPI00341A1EAB
MREMRRRIRATRWPDKETVTDRSQDAVTDRSQGAQLAKLRPLVEYWGKGYD